MSIFKGWPTLTEIFFGKAKDKKVVKKVAPKIATKSKAITPKAKPKATPKSLATPKVEKKSTKKELSKLTKVQLEELGRQKGIELDRRLTKDKLVKQLHKAL
jgi:hypothetical protein